MKKIIILLSFVFFLPACSIESQSKNDGLILEYKKIISRYQTEYASGNIENAESLLKYEIKFLEENYHDISNDIKKDLGLILSYTRLKFIYFYKDIDYFYINKKIKEIIPNLVKEQGQYKGYDIEKFERIIINLDESKNLKWIVYWLSKKNIH